MPTPFQHLVYAQQVLAHPALPAVVREPLQGAAGAYLLGNTGADVRAITGEHRAKTHFYRLSEPNAPPAGAAMLDAYPALADPWALSPEHAAFVSGYLVHLAYDERWAWDLFVPFYRDDPRWSDRLTYVMHHNALRVWLDRDALTEITREGTAVDRLRRTQPAGWLPFVEDGVLRAWRNWLVAQLEDPENVETMEVFAKRMGVPVRTLSAWVERLEAGTYSAVPGLGAALARYAVCARVDGVKALLRYWGVEEGAVRICRPAAAVGLGR